MNLAEIETFLTIVNTKSITRTADLLFLSQPTVSHRLTSLENELGFPLVIRQKGHKQVELTAKEQILSSLQNAGCLSGRKLWSCSAIRILCCLPSAVQTA